MVPIPRYLLEKEWSNSNFTIPIDPDLRNELRKKLEGFLTSPEMLFPQNNSVYKVLRARVMALRAYDAE